MLAKYSILALFFVSVTASAVPVAPSSVSVRSAVSKFYFSSEKVSFNQAWAYCKNAGLEFVSITTAVQNSALAEALAQLGASNTDFWIGGFYLRSGFLAKWFWVDGNQDFNYQIWVSVPILNSDSDYGVAFVYNSVKETGAWKHENTSTKNYFICEY